eukprot:TRINITY_DN1951_c0_g1_i3.p1 TRINITY_DN1951_c0_g1~~TRINITY_DN1951_c0_g1_i3.p1  ORF type:complete len:553 (+),score=181.33 TRINITY_DN1951_c0_g1_i3:102-1760(+)
MSRVLKYIDFVAVLCLVEVAALASVAYALSCCFAPAPTACLAVGLGGFWYLQGRRLYAAWAEPPPSLAKVSVVIIGGGFSGLSLGAQLQKAGAVDFKIFEAAHDIGGTWLANQYPGARCDVDSDLYSLSYFQNPAWSTRRAAAPEIHAYLKRFADAENLWPKIQLKTKVADAVWDDAAHEWVVTTEAGAVHRAAYVISCCGALRHAILPDLKGRDSFKGHAFHSSQWGAAAPDLTGKRVAIVGTGASAVQIVPEITDAAKDVYVFQRTPNWFLGVGQKAEKKVPWVERQVYAYFPWVQRASQALKFLAMELMALLWLVTGSNSETFRALIQKDMEEIMADRPDLLKKVIPDYPLGCKRLLLAGDFLKALKKPNVHLVTDAIECVTPDGIRVRGGSDVPLDVIVYATGFDIEQSICGFKAVGRTHPTALHGITVPRFPNFFICLGPNTVLAHNSVLFMIERQATYILDCLRQMARGGVVAVEPLEARAEAWQQRMSEMSQSRNFVSTACQGWYKNADGGNFILWPSNLVHYWWLTRKVDLLRDYAMTFAPGRQ